jgi:flagellar hook-associated protein 3 FlgL
MRVTQRALALTSLNGLNASLAQVQKLQQQMTSGKTISQPADDPTGTNTAMITRRGMAGNTQYARNISDGQTFLDSTDSAMQNMLTQVQRVRTLTVQGLNGGSMDTVAEGNLATEVNGIRESLIGAANQVVQGRPIFGGVTSGSKAYNDDGSYAGIGGDNGIAAQPLTRRVSDVETIRVDLTGPEAFGTPSSGKDLFSVVANISKHMSDPGTGATDTTALASDLNDLDGVINQMKTALADVGTREARMQTAATTNSSQQLSLQTTLSATEDVDLPKTIMNLQMQQVGYQAALQVTAQALQPTLLDYLK